MRSESRDEMNMSGYGSVTNTGYEVRDALGRFDETMAAGCFGDVLGRDPDCRFLVNHTGAPLARSPKTLTLTETARGLHFTASLDTRGQAASDIAVAVDRGDLDACSIGFVVARNEWSEDRSQRTILEVGGCLTSRPLPTPPIPPRVCLSSLSGISQRCPSSRALGFVGLYGCEGWQVALNR